AAKSSSDAEPAKTETVKTETAKTDSGRPDDGKPDEKSSTASTEPEKAANSGSGTGVEPAAKTEAVVTPSVPGMPQGEAKAKEASISMPPAAPTSNPRPAPRPMPTLA